MGIATPSWGTHYSDGLRSGPYPNVGASVNTQQRGNDSLNVACFTQYGPGVLHSPTFTYYINPKRQAVADVTETFADPAITATFLPLSGNIGATVKGNIGGVPYLQLDWPRVLVASVNVPNSTPLVFTITGEDWYGNRLTEVIQTLPVGQKTFGKKAFYKIFSVYYEGSIDLLNVTEISCSNSFGLPYRLFSLGDIVSIGWSSFTANTQEFSGGSDMGVAAVPGRIEPCSEFDPADGAGTVPAWCPDQGNAFQGLASSDIRGIYTPSAPIVALIDNPLNQVNLMFTYYIRGAHTWLNQMYAIKGNSPYLPPNTFTEGTTANPGHPLIPYDPAVNVANQGFPEPMPLNRDDLYGFPQYYVDTTL